jgi:signal transduction histidine kinase
MTEALGDQQEFGEQVETISTDEYATIELANELLDRPDEQALLIATGDVLTRQLGAAATLTAVAELSLPILGRWCFAYLVDADDHIHLMRLATLAPEKQPTMDAIAARFSGTASAEHPISQAIHDGQSRVLPRIDDGALSRLSPDPDYRALVSALGASGVLIVPLVSHGRSLGALTFGTDDPARSYNRRDLALASAVAARAAVALDNDRLVREERVAREAAQRAAARATFLAETSRAFASSLDLDEVLQLVAQLPVPLLADYTIVYRRGEDGRAHRVAMRHVRPDRSTFLDALEQSYPLPADSELAAAHVLRTNEPMFMPAMSVDEIPAGETPGPGYLDILRQLRPCSGLVLPLVARGRALGVLVLSMAECEADGSGRRYTEEDLVTGQALAERAALAADNAMLLAEARRARVDAERANRAKSDFLAVMSHELRTPLNAIAGYAELLQIGVRGPITAEQHRDLERIQLAQRRLLALVNDVLNLARIESGRLHVADDPIRVDELLDSVLPLVAPLFEKKGVACTRDAVDAALVVHGDRERTQQILLNLLSNAVKFTPAGGQVALRALADGERVHIEVRDSGVGIPGDMLESVFEPFVQVDSTLTRAAGGTGLGLAISRELARAMGAELWAEAATGAGTVIVLAMRR